MTTHTEQRPERVYSLDVLRGLAALSVVFWHWQHFFYSGGNSSDFQTERQPFFEELSFLYQHGVLAVEMFFCISGFVFFWLFAKSISTRMMSPGQFFIERFSRIYPLHLSTFLLVAMLQFGYGQNHSSYFVYQANDAYHALLNVLLIPAWGLENDWSFNAPVWSISIEVLLYGVFFLMCLTGRLRYWLIPCLVALGAYLYPSIYKLGTGLFCFFCGGIAYIVLDKTIDILGRKPTAWLTSLLALASWFYISHSPSVDILYVIGINFPVTVMAVAALGLAIRNFLKPLSAIGDMSYSSYLIHFPLQIVFALAVDLLGYSREVFYSPWMLILFLTILLPLSFASHRLFEMPVQRWIRRKWCGCQVNPSDKVAMPTRL